MANRNKIAKRVSDAIGSAFVAHKGIVYRPGFKHIAHGILIERTPYKDTNYVHHFVLPFLFPEDMIRLTYCRRITCVVGGRDNYYVGDDQTIADLIMRRLTESDLLETIKRPITLDEFAGTDFGQPLVGHHDAVQVFILAVACFLTGREQRARECLAYVGAWVNKEDAVRDAAGVPYSPAQDKLRRLLPIFDVPRPEAVAAFEAMIHENAVRLGFIPTLDEPPPA